MLNQDYSFEYKTEIASVLSESIDNPAMHTYAILQPLKDGEISGALIQFKNNAVPLLPLSEDEDLRDKGPQLITVESDSDMAKWLANTHGKRWVIYIQSMLEIEALQAFLSPLSSLINPAGEEYYFHFYDSVTLSHWLPVKENNHLLFTGISSIIYEGDAPWSLMRYHLKKNNNKQKKAYQIQYESLDLREKDQHFSALPLAPSDDNPSIGMLNVFDKTEFKALQGVQTHNFKLELRDALWKTHPYAQQGIEKTQDATFESIDLFTLAGIKQRNLLQALLIATFDHPEAWHKYKTQLINYLGLQQKKDEAQRTQSFCIQLEQFQQALEKMEAKSD